MQALCNHCADALERTAGASYQIRGAIEELHANEQALRGLINPALRENMATQVEIVALHEKEALDILREILAVL